MNMFVGSAALAGASVAIPAAAKGPIDTPYPVSPELHDAVAALSEAEKALKAAHGKKAETWGQFKAWSEAHPEPPHHKRRAHMKWEKWHRKVYDQLGVNDAWDECRKARNSYSRARANVANFKATNENDLVLKCCAAALYEDGKQEHLRQNMEGCQLISVSVAWDTVSVLRPRQQ